MMNVYSTSLIAILKPAAVDQWGVPVSEPTERTLYARLDEKTRLIRNETGQETVSSSQVTVPANIDIAVGYSVRHLGWVRRVIAIQVKRIFVAEQIVAFLE